MIRVERLTKFYAAFRALHDVTFRVERGEVVGFLGPNGAGKTTTLRILSGFMPASGGRAWIADRDVTGESREVRRRTGYLPEDVPLYRDLTVDAFLRYMGGLKNVPARELRREVDRVAARTGLDPVRNKLLSKCSKGFRQRTGLAMALLGNPPVLLLDEPTSGLDPNQVVEVRELIRELSGEKTVLLSSHILSEVSQICSRVLIVNGGRLVAAGTPEELARRFGATERMLVRVAGPVDGARLESIPGVLAAEARNEGEWRVNVENPKLAGPAIAREVVAAGADLLEMRPESVDLEAVFRRATAEGADA